MKAVSWTVDYIPAGIIASNLDHGQIIPEVPDDEVTILANES